jgi:gliding motility-associated-like protein
MNKTLRMPAIWLLTLLLWLASTQASWASHIQGGQISYRYVGPGAAGTNRYSVTVTYFRDCTGITLPTSLTLNARRGGCTGTAVTATLSAVGSPITGTPYCASVQATVSCSTSSPQPLYQYQNFTGNIDLAPAPEWTLGVDDSARPSTANLTAQGGFRFEAKLYSQFVPTGGGTAVNIQNNSPQYSSQDLPVPFVQLNQLSSISFAANEPDGDSLVYALEAPLQSCGSFNAYKAIPGTCAPTPTVPGCTFVCPPTGPGRTYSAQMPIAVGYAPTACSGGTYTMTPNLTFVPQTGLLTFTPNRYVATAPINGDNKYVVVCKISEYRAVAGQSRKVLIGSVRRDFLVTVVQGTGNNSPNPPVTVIDSVTVGGTAINSPLRTRIEILSCNFSQARITFTDPDNIVSPTNPVSRNQLLNVTYAGATPIGTLVPASLGTVALTNNNTTVPVLVLTFQPSPAYIGQTISLTYRVEDNACPIKGTQTRVIEIFVRDGRKVRSQAQVTSVGLNGTGAGSTQTVAVCPGGAVNLNGFVTAVDSVRQVINGRISTVAQSYDLLWFAPGGQGLPTVRSAMNVRALPITVRPTVTTRYTLFSNPRTGNFPVDAQGLNACGDSVSVLVKVLPQPVAAIAATDTMICAGAPVTLRGSAFRTDGIVDTYRFAWAGTGVTGSTASQVTVAPLTTTTYTLTATGDPRFGCEGSKRITIRVIPPPTIGIAATDTVVCPGATVTLRGSATRSDGIVDTYRFAWAGTGVTGSTASQVTVNPRVTTRYMLNVNSSSSLGCEGTKSITIRVVPTAVADFVVSDSVSSAGGSRGGRLLPPIIFSFANQSRLSSGVTPFAADTVRYTYQRVRTSRGEPVLNSPEVTFARGTVALAPVSVKLIEAGYYIIRLRVATAAGGLACGISTAARTVVVPDFEVPNIITPNGDGLNDTFVIVGSLVSARLEVYNRWGRKVSEYTNYQNQWGGQDQPDGVYYYYLTEPGGKTTKGWIEVVRGQ